jgi:16S rRNA (uracil1498-N3)-methyltransferase
MHRFSAVLKDNIHKAFIDDSDDLNHLLKVLRLRQGDEVELVNGQGLLALARLGSLSSDKACLDIVKISQVPPSSGPRTVLACAIPKRSKFEDIIDATVQLGVDDIYPMITERTVPFLDDRSAEKKLERYRKVCHAAVLQSRRLWAPRVHPVLSFSQALRMAREPRTVSYIPYLGEDLPSLSGSLHEAKDHDTIIFFIGPEGDFTPKEVLDASKSGAHPVSLGKNVLRVATAAQMVVTMARHFI